MLGDEAYTLLRVLALIPLAPVPKALIGFVDEEPKAFPKLAGPNVAGEKAPLRELLESAVIGDRPDIAPIGFEKDIPGKPPYPAGPKLSLRRGHFSVSKRLYWKNSV